MHSILMFLLWFFVILIALFLGSAVVAGVLDAVKKREH